MINALVTGSQKYGTPAPGADVNVVLLMEDEKACLFGSDAACPPMWLFDQVLFVQSAIFPTAHVEFGPKGVDVYCSLSDDDFDLLGGLEKWVRVDEGGGGFRSTQRNDRVKFVPVADQEVWETWKVGTESLFCLAPATKEQAIEFFDNLE